MSRLEQVISDLHETVRSLEFEKAEMEEAAIAQDLLLEKTTAERDELEEENRKLKSDLSALREEFEFYRNA